MVDFRKEHPILFQEKKDVPGPGALITNRLALYEEYRSLYENAPSRASRKKTYFVGHCGVPSTTGDSNRYEEHSAIALVNSNREWEHPLGGVFWFLDYQVPLKAQMSDYGVGEIDIVGVNDKGRLILTELKVEASQGGGSDSPCSALLQGLRYAAIVDKNIKTIAEEAHSRYKKTVLQEPPIVQLLAPKRWWLQQGFDFTLPGGEQKRFGDLTDDIRNEIGLIVECLAFDHLDATLGGNGTKPMLKRVPTLYEVRLR